MKRWSAEWSRGHGAQGATGRLKVEQLQPLSLAVLGRLSPGWARAESSSPPGASLQCEHPRIPPKPLVLCPAGHAAGRKLAGSYQLPLKHPPGFGVSSPACDLFAT